MVNKWWSSDPLESYWIEITDRPDIGEDLKAPQTTNAGHVLVNEVQRGDIVYHYDKNKRAVTHYSIATGDNWEQEINWPHPRDGWYAGLEDLTAINPIPLSQLMEDWEDLLEPELTELRKRTKGSTYHPFTRHNFPGGVAWDVRPVQGLYLAKLPRFFVEYFEHFSPGQPNRYSAIPTEQLVDEVRTKTEEIVRIRTETSMMAKAIAGDDLAAPTTSHMDSLFISFNPHDINSVPDEAGVYVFYQANDMISYVGKAKNARSRVKNHTKMKWFIPEYIHSGLFFPEPDEEQRERLETILIKFQKSNILLNKQKRYKPGKE